MQIREQVARSSEASVPLPSQEEVHHPWEEGGGEMPVPLTSEAMPISLTTKASSVYGSAVATSPQRTHSTIPKAQVTPL